MDIKKYLHHRYPFLFVDGVDKIASNPDDTTGTNKTEIKVYTDVRKHSHLLEGHFPGNPVFPGVLIVEAMAQAGCVLLAYSSEQSLIQRGLPSDEPLAHADTYLTKIKEASFKKIVKNDDLLYLTVTVANSKKLGRNTFFEFDGIAEYKGEVACLAKFSAVLAERAS